MISQSVVYFLDGLEREDGVVREPRPPADEAERGKRDFVEDFAPAPAGVGGRPAGEEGERPVAFFRGSSSSSSGMTSATVCICALAALSMSRMAVTGTVSAQASAASEKSRLKISFAPCVSR